jgi:hypothetical protein
MLKGDLTVLRKKYKDDKKKMMTQIQVVLRECHTIRNHYPSLIVFLRVCSIHTAPTNTRINITLITLGILHYLCVCVFISHFTNQHTH